MLESTVVFLPRLRGIEQYALRPLGDQARSGASEVLVPISSTNTSCFGSICWASITLQAALCHSSRSSAPTLLFFRLKPIRLSSLLKVGSLRLLPAKLMRKWRLSLTVAAGLVRMSSSSSLFVASSALGGRPPPLLGARDSPRSASLT